MKSDVDFFITAFLHLEKTRRNLKRSKIAKDAGISPSYLTLILSKDRRASMDIFADIARALGMSLSGMLFLGQRLSGEEASCPFLASSVISSTPATEKMEGELVVIEPVVELMVNAIVDQAA